jgi:putative lipoic acid-binding regulatory protein
MAWAFDVHHVLGLTMSFFGDHRPSVELLESVHAFPGSYRIKAIGDASDDFEGRVLAAVRHELAPAGGIELSVRYTRDGRHASLTLDLSVQSAEEVRAIYGRISQVAGLTLLL